MNINDSIICQYKDYKISLTKKEEMHEYVSINDNTGDFENDIVKDVYYVYTFNSKKIIKQTPIQCFILKRALDRYDIVYPILKQIYAITGNKLNSSILFEQILSSQLHMTFTFNQFNITIYKDKREVKLLISVTEDIIYHKWSLDMFKNVVDILEKIEYHVNKLNTKWREYAENKRNYEKNSISIDDRVDSVFFKIIQYWNRIHKRTK